MFSDVASFMQIMTNFIRLFVIYIQLQAMVFSKNQSEREIDELHSNYSKSLFFKTTDAARCQGDYWKQWQQIGAFQFRQTNRFKQLLLNLFSCFSSIILMFSNVYQMLYKYSVLVLAQRLCVQDKDRK